MNQLSLAELQRAHPGQPHGDNQRFCCPLPACAEKAQTAAHRSLAVNIRTGEYLCHRCGAKGVLADFQTHRSTRQNNQRPLTPSSPTASDEWRSRLQGMQPFVDDAATQSLGYFSPECESPAASYLRTRCIPPLFPRLCEVRYHPNWFGQGEAVLFPILDAHGVLMAIQGRFLHPRVERPKVMTAGPVKSGVFATTHAWEQTTVMICEAPIDALSLAICGVPSIATCGAKNFPSWLPNACIGKRVIIGHDPDKGGDEGAALLQAALVRVGVIAERLAPPIGNDWNGYLVQYGQQSLAVQLASSLMRCSKLTP